MSTKVLPQSNHILTVTAEERDSLIDLLRQTLGEARVEAHRTHTPAFREGVLGQEKMIRALIAKLERLGTVPAAAAPTISAGIEEGSPVGDTIYVDDQGRFQMAIEELEDFIHFLGDNGVRAEAEPPEAFHAMGKAYGYGRLLHMFDADSAQALYRTWTQSHWSQPAGQVV